MTKRGEQPATDPVTTENLWARFTDNEKTAVRFGMIPLWAAAELERAYGLTAREIALKFFGVAKRDGGLRS